VSSTIFGISELIINWFLTIFAIKSLLPHKNTDQGITIDVYDSAEKKKKNL
jgi:hypothetical protein